MVGAVVVRDGEIVGEGAHESFGKEHAEINALRVAGKCARGGTLYVTLEPCNHFGKTGPCTEAIVAAGIDRVIVAAQDPNPEAGGGIGRLRAAGVVTDCGVCEGEARELNAAYFHSFVSDKPWVTLKLALSLDGAIADAALSGGFLSNAQSRCEVQRMRANVDAIAVGVDTVIIDNPTLTVRTTPPPRVTPLRLVFDRSGRLPPDRTIVQQQDVAPTLVLREPDMSVVLQQLHERGIRSILVEGGGGIAATLLNAGLVDRLVIFQTPVILGRGALNAFGGVAPAGTVGAARFPVVRRQEFGDDLMTIYAIHAV
jgi:diaminohydroxyphosphoribosylaminopyrimidine deaminase/5-amino-6-(5-phosphoribosylamino)uracil reductase